MRYVLTYTEVGNSKNKVKTTFSVLNKGEKNVLCQSVTGTRYTMPTAIFNELLTKGSLKKLE